MPTSQIEVTGDFSKALTEFKRLAGVIGNSMGSAADQVASLNRVVGEISKGGSRAQRTLAGLAQKAAALAQSAKPLSSTEFTEQLFNWERKGGGAHTEAGQQLGQLLRESQQKAVINALSDTSKDINQGFKDMLTALTAQRVEVTDASGKVSIQRVGQDAKEAIRNLHAAIAAAAKKGIEYIDADAIQKWGIGEFGSAWQKTGVTGLSLSGSGSAQTELSRVLTKANNEIYKNIKASIEAIVTDATSSGKQVSQSVVSDLQSRLNALRKGASFDGLTGDALKRRLVSIDKFSKDIIEKVRRYNDGLVEQAGIDKLESRIKAVSDSLTRKGNWSGSSGDLASLFKTAGSDVGVKLTRQFDELRVLATNFFKKEIAEFEKVARTTGTFDSTTFTSALKSGVDWNTVVEGRRRVFAAIGQYRQQEASNIAKSLAADSKAIDGLLRSAFKNAYVAGDYSSKSLENAIQSFVAKGGDASHHYTRLRRINRVALEERIKRDLASDAKLARGIEEAYRIEAYRHGVDTQSGKLPQLFKELADRKEKELQTAVDKFNERYTAALLRLKERFIQKGFDREYHDVFKAQWTREAADLNLKFDLSALTKAVDDAAAARRSEELRRAGEKVAKDNQRLVDRVKSAIANAGYKGTGVSVSTATPLFNELQAAISSATNNTGSLVSAVAQLRLNVFKGLSAEIKQLEKDAVAAGSAIKQSDITAIQSKIAAAAPNLLSHEVARLNAALGNAVRTVDTAVRQQGIENIRNALTSAANNLELSSKEILTQIKTASESLRSLGVSRAERVGAEEFLHARANALMRLDNEAALARESLRKQALSVLRGLNATAELSAKVIADARKQLVSAGGNGAQAQRIAVPVINENLEAKVRELVAAGNEFPKELVRFYNNLYQAAGVSGSELKKLMAEVRGFAEYTNANAQVMRVDALRSKINEVYQQANQLGQVVSKTIEEGLVRQWESLRASLPSGTVGDFRAEFGAELLGQKTVRANNALRQMLEGVWKPYVAELDKLALYARTKVGKELNAETFTGEFLQQLRNRFYRVEIALREQIREGLIAKDEGNAALATLKTQFESVSKEAKTAVTRRLSKEIRKLSDDIKGILDSASPASHAAELPKIGVNIKRIRGKLINSLKTSEKAADAALSKLVEDYKNVTKSINTELTLKRVDQLLRSGARKLGGEAALQVELTEIRKAHAELIAAVRTTDRALAKRLSEQAKALQQQAREQFAARSVAGGKGQQGGHEMIGGVPAGIYQNYLRQLPMQITDIVVGLSTGQRPLYVLLQQGGQLKDMFGGIGNAVKEVGKYIMGLLTPLNIAIAAAGALSLSFAAIVNRAGNLRKEMLQTNVVLSGAAGRSFDFETVRAYGRELSRMYGIMESSGRKAFMSLAQNARLPEKMLQPIIENVRDLQAFLGKGFDSSGLQETLTLLGNAFSIGTHGDGLMNLKEFLKSLNIWDDESAKLVVSLYKQAAASKDVNEKTDKMREIFDLVSERAKNAADQGLTEFQRASRDAKLEIIKAWNVIADDSAWNTLFENLSTAGIAVMEFAQSAFKNLKNVWYAIKETGAKLWEGRAGAVTRGIGEVGLGIGAAAISPLYTFHPDKRVSDILTPALSLMAKGSGRIGGALFNFNGYGSYLDAQGEAAGKRVADEFWDSFTFESNKKAAAASRLLTESDFGETKPKSGGGSRSGAQTDKDLENAQRYVQQLKEQYDQVSKMNVSQRLAYDIETGKVKLQGELLDKAREYARIIDERALAEAEATRQMQLQTLHQEKLEALENRRREMQYEVAKLRGSDRSADYFKGLIEFDVELERNVKRLRKARDEAVLKAQLDLKPAIEIERIRKHYDDQIAYERWYTQKSISLYKQRQKEIDEYSRQWITGYRKGLEEVADWLFDISSEAASAVESWAGSFADALAKAARTGKLSFKDMADSILDDIARMASRQFVSALFGGFQYGWSSVPQSSQGKVAQEIMAKNTVQKVFVTNPSIKSFGDAAKSLGGIEDAVKSSGFTLGGGTNTGLGDDPWGLAGVSGKVVDRIGTEVSPAIRDGASHMFSGLFDKIGSIFSGIGSSISGLFSSIKLPSFSSGGGGGGGFFSSLFSGIGSFFSNIFGSLFASGGYTGAGGKYSPAGIVHKGEFVINAASTRKLGLDFLNRLNGYANGGYVTPTPSIVHSNMSKDMNNGLEVNIYNQTDSKITAQRNSNGGLDIFVEQAVNAVAGNIAAGGSVATAIQRAYALNRGVGTQRTGY